MDRLNIVADAAENGLLAGDIIICLDRMIMGESMSYRCKRALQGGIAMLDSAQYSQKMIPMSVMKAAASLDPLHPLDVIDVRREQMQDILVQENKNHQDMADLMKFFSLISELELARASKFSPYLF